MHVPVHIESWSQSQSLPLYLTAAYRFVQAEVAGVPMLWIVSEDAVTPGALGKHLAQVAPIWGGPSAMVFRSLTPSQRQRLVAAALDFVVPGNQVYLPSLGVDLRERARTARTQRERLCPAAPALLLGTVYAGAAVTNIGILAPGGTVSTRARCCREDAIGGGSRAARSGS